MNANGSLSRRGFIAATTGAAAAGAAGAAAAQEETEGNGTETGNGTEGGGEGTEGGGEGTEGGGEGTEGGDEGTEGEGDGGGGGGEGVPDFGSYLQDANEYSEGDVADERGSDEVTVQVGAGDGLAFDPAGIWIDPGTTVVWEWTGEGGGHNVSTNEGEADLSSDIVSEEGHTFEHEFTEDEAGITTYRCEPHEGQGMKGGVAVGDDVPTVQPSGGGGGEAAVEIPDQAMALSLATTMAMGTTLALGYVFMKYGGDVRQDDE